MALRQCWIAPLLLLCFACPISWTAADNLAEHKEIFGNNLSAPLLANDLEQQLRNFFQHNFLIQELLDRIFIRPQLTPHQAVTPRPFLSHKGKNITSITLYNQGIFSSQATWWQSILYKITPITRDWVTWNQSHFAVGDRLVPQQLIQSEISLIKFPFIRKAKIEVQERTGSNNTVDLHVTTKDRLPITWALNPIELRASLGYNNLLGWGHNLQGQLLYRQRLGYGVRYRAPNIGRSGITSELQYLHTPKKSIRCFRDFRGFDNQASYAGEITLSHKRLDKQLLLDGYTHLQPSSWSYYHWDSWLGKAFSSNKEDGQGQFVMTGRVFQQHFIQRPQVTQSLNRYFHHYVFGVGSLGFTNKCRYEDRLIYGVGAKEYIPYGNKINLIGGYQFGEFLNRPYLRLDLVQGGRLLSLGHWYSVVNIGGFWHAKTVEQGIVKLHLSHFTPLLKLGNQWMRQFINLSYLEGFNLFTGEFISTNTNKVSPKFRDPF